MRLEDSPPPLSLSLSLRSTWGELGPTPYTDSRRRGGCSQLCPCNRKLCSGQAGRVGGAAVGSDPQMKLL